MQILNRQETEDHIIDLYYNQKMTFREIQKIARKSPRYIKAVLDKVEPERSSSFSAASRSYRMFKEGSSLTDVAIALNLREKEVSEYYREFWNLNEISSLNDIYEEIKNEISSFLELYKSIKSANMGTQHVVTLLKIANNDLPSVEIRFRELEKAEAILNSRIQEATRNLNELNNRILQENETLERNRSESNQLKEEIKNMRMEKLRIENAISFFKTNNETSVWIKEIVRQEIEILQSDPKKLLRCVLVSIFESERKHPGKLRALYYNNPPTLSIERLLSVSRVEQSRSHYSSDEDSIEKLLLDEAEQVLTRIVESLADKCLNDMFADRSTNAIVDDAESSSQSPIPKMLPGPSTDEGHADISLDPSLEC